VTATNSTLYVVNHHATPIKFSLAYCAAVRIVLAAQRWRTSVQRYYCFNVVQQMWVAMLLLVPC